MEDKLREMTRINYNNPIISVYNADNGVEDFPVEDCAEVRYHFPNNADDYEVQKEISDTGVER